MRRSAEAPFPYLGFPSGPKPGKCQTIHGTRRFLLLSTRYHDSSRLLKRFSRRTHTHRLYPAPVWLIHIKLVSITSFGVWAARSGKHNNDGIVAAGNEIGMVFLWHYDSSGDYEYYDTDVRISPHNSLARWTV